MSNKQPPDPFDIVSKALGCPREALSAESEMYRDHGWDSFGHLKVIVALEAAYDLRINNETVERFTTMKAIKQYYDEFIQPESRHGG